MPVQTRVLADHPIDRERSFEALPRVGAEGRATARVLRQRQYRRRQRGGLRRYVRSGDLDSARFLQPELEQPSRSPSPSSDSDNDSNTEDLHAIFKRAFEAKFKPLPVEAKEPKLEEVQLEEDEEEGSKQESDDSCDREEGAQLHLNLR